MRHLGQNLQCPRAFVVWIFCADNNPPSEDCPWGWRKCGIKARHTAPSEVAAIRDHVVLSRAVSLSCEHCVLAKKAENQKLLWLCHWGPIQCRSFPLDLPRDVNITHTTFTSSRRPWLSTGWEGRLRSHAHSPELIAA